MAPFPYEALGVSWDQIENLFKGPTLLEYLGTLIDAFQRKLSFSHGYLQAEGTQSLPKVLIRL